MKGFTTLAVVLVVLACSFAPVCADQSWEYTNYPGYNQGAGYLYTYWSLVQYGNGFPAYYYNYTLQNNSNQYDVVGWTWYYGAKSGALFPHPAGAEYIDGYDLPLLAAATYDDMQYRCEDNDSVPSAPFAVTSIIHWGNGHQTEVPVYVPISEVPEPASAASLAVGILGAVGLAWRRRK